MIDLFGLELKQLRGNALCVVVSCACQSVIDQYDNWAPGGGGLWVSTIKLHLHEIFFS